jgi:hypothetical protein
VTTEPASIDDLSEYERIGDPNLPYEPTRRDQRRQRQAEEIREAARRQVAGMPPPSPAAVARVAALLKSFRDSPPQPWQLMRWRLRLFCGHLVECTAHYTHKTVHAAFSALRGCPQCGRDPIVIVAAEPLGLAGQPPGRRMRSQKERPTRAQLERRVAELEVELSRLQAREAAEHPDT